MFYRTFIKQGSPSRLKHIMQFFSANIFKKDIKEKRVWSRIAAEHYKSYKRSSCKEAEDGA